ncbi:MAG: hypothetical protein ABI593_17770 [Betaproteobacteria bacterium]
MNDGNPRRRPKTGHCGAPRSLRAAGAGAAGRWQQPALLLAAVAPATAAGTAAPPCVALLGATGTAATADTRPVCRYYLPPAFGDSHFYSASPAECADVGQRFPAFVLESDAVFHAVVPDAAGACPPPTVPVYRLWNRRIDSNHRYTTDRALRAHMIAGGSMAEGRGPDDVAMCVLP